MTPRLYMILCLPILPWALIVAASCGEETGPLSLMTYNVKGLDWGNTKNPTYPVAARTADLVTTIRAHAPDVLAIQEAWSRSAGGALVEELAAACDLPHTFAVTTTQGWLPYVQQNIILSRHPVGFTATLDLGPDPSSYENRQLQVVELQTSEGTLCLGNLHLFTEQALQRPAMEKVVPFLAQQCGDLPVVLAGDFNFEPDKDPNSPYGFLTNSAAPALRDAVVVLGQDPFDPRHFTSPATKPRQRIDLFFLDGGSTAVDCHVVDAPIPNRTYPDHLPVLLDLSIGSD